MNFEVVLSYPPFSSVSNIPFLWKYVSISNAIFTERALKHFHNAGVILSFVLCPLFRLFELLVTPLHILGQNGQQSC